MNAAVLIEALVTEKVDFVLVGGLAAMFNGTTRVSLDVDIAYATYTSNLEGIARVLNRFEPRIKFLGKPSDEAITVSAATIKRQRVMQFVTSAGEIDILDVIGGFRTYGQIKSYSTVEDYGFPINILGIEGLIKAKRALKRPKDLADLIELEALLELRNAATAERSSE